MITAVIKWCLLAIAGMAFTVLAMFLAPVLPLFVRPDGYIPTWFSWFQTPDNPALEIDSSTKLKCRGRAVNTCGRYSGCGVIRRMDLMLMCYARRCSMGLCISHLVTSG